MRVYPLKFIQKDKCWDNTDHISTYIYTFFSPVTKLKYVVRSEYFATNTFALKFYAKKDRRSREKYSRIINKGDVFNILLTVGSVIEVLLKIEPLASFAFASSRSIDRETNRIEPFPNNQRFRIYASLIPTYIGDETFDHILYKSISSYLLLNKKNQDLESLRLQIEKSFQLTYNDLLNF